MLPAADAKKAVALYGDPGGKLASPIVLNKLNSAWLPALAVSSTWPYSTPAGGAVALA